MVDNCIVSDGGSKMIRSPPSSKSYISGLSDELLVEILCRLGSPKYATQCKCICKRWFSLINTNSSGSYFLRCWHRIHGKSNKEDDEELPVAILSQFLLWQNEINYSFNSDQKLQFVGSLDSLPLIHSTRCILGTFKDIVLCCPWAENHSVYFICNPFTRQWTALPPPPSFCGYPRTQAGLFVSEDEGYGFVFKVVRITCSNPGDTNRVIVDIFSSDDVTGGWRQILMEPESSDIYRYGVFNMRPLSYDGMMVWLGEDEECFTGMRINPIDPKVVTSYFCIPYPLGYEIHRSYNTDRPRSLIGVCMGCLRVAQVVNSPLPIGNDMNYGLKLLVWELDRHSQSSWELVHELDFSEIEDSKDSSSFKRCYQNGSSARSNYSVMAFHPHDRDILYLYFVPPHMESTSWEYSPVFLCNARERTLKEIGGLQTRSKCVAFPLLLPTWPTPVPLLFNPTVNPPPLPMSVYSWNRTRKLHRQTQPALPTEPQPTG